MDTSEIYIKMCDCPEIQEQRQLLVTKKKFKDGDYIANHREEWKKIDEQTKKATAVFLGIVVYSERHTYIQNREFAVWLPRQDQIQEMAGLPISAWGLFYGWVFNKDEDNKEPWQYFNTGEKLWLAFYMHEKHQKIWDGKEWMKKS